MKGIERTPLQGKRAQAITDSAIHAHVRAKVRAVLAQCESLALDNARDRAQLERMLVEELTK